MNDYSEFEGIEIMNYDQTLLKSQLKIADIDFTMISNMEARAKFHRVKDPESRTQPESDHPLAKASNKNIK